MSASTAASASEFAWMSESMAMRMGARRSPRIAGATGAAWPLRPHALSDPPLCCGSDSRGHLTVASTRRLSCEPFFFSPSPFLRRRAHPLHRSHGMIRHHFTVDVEEYFQVTAFEPHVRRADWGRFESRVVGCVSRLLDLLASRDARATFFILGWVAQRQPDLVQRIGRAGHEIASHGWDHCRVTEQSPLAFRDSVRHSKHLLEDLAAAPVLGFRAP